MPALPGERRPGGVPHPGNDKVRFGDVVKHGEKMFIVWSAMQDVTDIDEIPEIPGVPN